MKANQTGWKPVVVTFYLCITLSTGRHQHCIHNT